MVFFGNDFDAPGSTGTSIRINVSGLSCLVMTFISLTRVWNSHDE